jgi:UDP-N-acetylglucosamine transferase subunit ALG13
MAPSRSSKPLVVVLVGTDHHPFDRLVGWVDAWAAGHDARVVIQHGTATPPEHAEGVRLLPGEELAALLQDATAVVCHGGPGTIADARAAGRLPIVVARDPKRGEHVDDHQQRFVVAAARAGEIRAVDGREALASELDAALADPLGQRIDAGARDVRAAVARFGERVSRLFEPAPVHVLFIAGWGRSGSTLLDRMLGQVPGVFSAGELRDIWQRGVVEDRLCGCGEPFRSCPVWRKVGDVAFGGWDQLDVAAVQRLRQRLDRPWSVPLLLASRVTPSIDADVARYVSVLSKLYAAIAEVTDAKLIVDSSKIATFAMLVRQSPEVALRTVHLVRDPRGVINSWRKQVVRADGGGDDAMYRYGVVPASARYVAYNAMAHGLWALAPYRFARYEDLVADPRREVAATLSFAGVDVDDDALAFLRPGEADLAPNHTVDGNPMRLQAGPIAIHADEGWRTALPDRDRRVVRAITAPLSMAYGYR